MALAVFRPGGLASRAQGGGAGVVGCETKRGGASPVQLLEQRRDNLWDLVYVDKDKNSSKGNKIPSESAIKKLVERNKKLSKLFFRWAGSFTHIPRQI